MTRLILVLLASTAATPALAQHSGHGQSEPAPTAAPIPAPVATCTPEHAAMGHCTVPAPAPAPPCTPEYAAMGHCTLSTPAPASTPAPVPGATCTPEHAAMGHCQMPAAPSVQPAAPTAPATCTPEHAAMGHCTSLAEPTLSPAAEDPHAGHPMPAQQATTSPGSTTCLPEHAAMGHCTLSTAVEIPVAAPPPEALSGPIHAQDLFFNPAEAARSRAQLAQEHGGLSAYKFLIDQLEATVGDGPEGYAWDAQFWYGGDINKFWVTTEGEGEFGENLEGAEVQALWSRAIDPWFDLQAGIRHDLNTGPDRTHLVLGVQGLAPYWFELDAAVFLSTGGELTARFEGEYDLRLTQALILQPRVEVNFSLQNVPELGLGAGLTTTEIGARLRYDFFPDRGPAVIAPYLGVEYEQAWATTEDFRVAAGEDSGGVRLVGGIRLWF